MVVVDGRMVVRVVLGDGAGSAFEAADPVARVVEHEHNARARAEKAALWLRLVVKYFINDLAIDFLMLCSYLHSDFEIM